MDKDKKDTMEVISSEINTRFQVEKVSDIFYHNILAVNAPTTYTHLNIKEFILLYRIECLFDKGLITEKVKEQLFELFNLYKELWKELNELLSKDILTDKELTIEESARKKELENQCIHIDEIFDNYHLLDEIDLEKVISNSVSVDIDLDLESEIKKIK